MEVRTVFTSEADIAQPENCSTKMVNTITISARVTTAHLLGQLVEQPLAHSTTFPKLCWAAGRQMWPKWETRWYPSQRTTGALLITQYI